MKTFKQLMALLLVFVLVAACVPLGTITAFAAENDGTDISAVDTEMDAEPEESTEPAKTENEAAPPPDESAGTEPEEEPQPETPNPFLDLANEFDPEVLDFLWELFPDGEIPVDFDLVDFFNSYTTYGGSSGSETGDGGGGGNAAGSGTNNQVAVGVTMQIVYSRYDQCYNRYNSHGSVINTLQTGKAIPWNSTGKDNGSTATTVFDTFTISPHNFVVKCFWNSYPFVYHFPTENIASDGCQFSWPGFADYFFTYNNPGGQPSTYPRIVRNEAGGSLEIEQYLARIILGNNYGAWDKTNIARGETVATDTSLYAATLKYLGANDLAVQNYLDAYYGKLSITQNGSTLIPTIIWSWVGAENLGGTNRIYTIGDVAAYGTSNSNWLKTAYTSSAAANAGFGACSWMNHSSDTMICKAMLGASHYTPHGSAIWTRDGSSNLFGTGFVNRIQTQVDATAENGTNTFYYLRGYWTPYGTGNGSISLTKTQCLRLCKAGRCGIHLISGCCLYCSCDEQRLRNPVQFGYRLCQRQRPQNQWKRSCPVDWSVHRHLFPQRNQSTGRVSGERGCQRQCAGQGGRCFHRNYQCDTDQCGELQAGHITAFSADCHPWGTRILPWSLSEAGG